MAASPVLQEGILKKLYKSINLFVSKERIKTATSIKFNQLKIKKLLNTSQLKFSLLQHEIMQQGKK